MKIKPALISDLNPSKIDGGKNSPTTHGEVIKENLVKAGSALLTAAIPDKVVMVGAGALDSGLHSDARKIAAAATPLALLLDVAEVVLGPLQAIHLVGDAARHGAIAGFESLVSKYGRY